MKFQIIRELDIQVLSNCGDDATTMDLAFGASIDFKKFANHPMTKMRFSVRAVNQAPKEL